jgi:hypothetical protein
LHSVPDEELYARFSNANDNQLDHASERQLPLLNRIARRPIPALQIDIDNPPFERVANS